MPDIKIAEVKPNKLQSQVEGKISRLLSTLYDIDWTDKMEIFGFIFYCFPKCVDLKQLVFLQKISLFGFLLDDHLDKYVEEREKWANIFETKKITTETPLELLFENLWNDAINELTEGQQQRILDGFSIFMSAFKDVDAVKSGEKLVNVEEYIKIRTKDSFHTITWVLCEYVCGYALDGVINSDLVTKLNDIAGKHGYLVNDLFSFQKELAEEGALTIVSLL